MKPKHVIFGRLIQKTSRLLTQRVVVVVVMITGIFLVSFQLSSIAQTAIAVTTKSIEPYHLVITCNKTSNLIFPYAIKSVDRGSSVVLAQKAKGVNNILQVKAAKQNFPQTNLTVVTSDGQFYSFLLDYANEPSTLNLSFSKDSMDNTGELAAKDKAVLSDGPLDEAEYTTITSEINRQQHFLRLRSHEQKMFFSLRSIWLKDKVMWLTLQLRNQSLIDYSPDYIRFFARDKKRGKRTAVQETEILPLYGNADSVVAGRQSRKIVFAFRPFTIPKTQELVIQVGERNGGRSLVLPASHKAILKARYLP